jgi:hypothetical protein
VIKDWKWSEYIAQCSWLLAYMWQMIMGIYDSDPRLTNDRKRSCRVGKAWKWLGRVRNAQRVFGGVHP